MSLFFYINAYNEVVRWKRNLFVVHTGKVGDSFVSELSRLYRTYGESSTMEPIAFMAAMTFLQKPFARSKSKDHMRCLEKRMDLWREGKVPELVSECRCIQQRLSVHKR